MTNDELTTEIQQIQHTLYTGNGTPPMVARMSKAENDIQTLYKKLDKIEARSAWLIKLVISNLIVGIGQYLPKIIALCQAQG